MEDVNEKIIFEVWMKGGLNQEEILKIDLDIVWKHRLHYTGTYFIKNMKVLNMLISQGICNQRHMCVCVCDKIPHY